MAKGRKHAENWSQSVSYVRVSTAGQADEGVSLEVQAARIADTCRARGWRLDPADRFADEGVSGKRADNRPGLQNALVRAVEQKAVLCFYSLSRLGRSVRDLNDIADRLREGGAGLASVTEPIDTTTPIGSLFFQILAALAQFEREQISERTRAALAYKIERGERAGQIPYGSRLAKDGVRLEAEPAEANLVELIGELAAEGKSLREIANELNYRGYPTKRGGRHWARSTVRRLIGRAGESEAQPV